MDEFPGLLARDFGFRLQGKSAPMSASKGVGVTNLAGTTTGSARSGAASPPLSGDFFGAGRFGDQQNSRPLHHDDDGIFFSGGVGAAKYSTDNPISSSSSAFSYDPFFQGSKDHQGTNSKSSSSSSTLPVYDKPVYDDDIFNGVPGVKSSFDINHENVFASMSSAAASNHTRPPPHEDDLLANLGQPELVSKGAADRRFGEPGEQDIPGFDDLIPGFGGSSPPQMSGLPETNHQQSTVPSTRSVTNIMDDPFLVLESTSVPEYVSSGMSPDPLEHINTPSGSKKSDVSSARLGENFDVNAFDGFLKSVPSFSSEIKNDGNPLDTLQNTSAGHPIAGKEPNEVSSGKGSGNNIPRMTSVKNNPDSHQTMFDLGSSDFVKAVHGSGAPSLDAYVNQYKTNFKAGISKKSGHSVTAGDVWLTVSEIHLFTQPTSAPPPSRSPPAFVIKQATFAHTDKDASVGVNARRRVNDSFPQSAGSYPCSESCNDTQKTSAVSSIDELEDFAMGQHPTYEHVEAFSSEEDTETNSAAAASAAAMKEAMNRAEARFKHAREVRERESDLRSAKNRETTQLERDEKGATNAEDQELKEKQERLNREREQKEREEKEKERKRLEKEKERELERERARQAVERANREARERAAAEAHQRAEKAARERAERAAVQRAAAEARGRAAAGAKERAEKLAAEVRERERADAAARERTAAEARENAAAVVRDKAVSEARERAAVERAAAEVRARAQRAAVERAAAEARERAAAEAREKAAGMAREKQHTNDDLESFFGMGVRANSAPRQRATTDSTFDQMQNKGSSEGLWRTSAGSSSNMRKANSVADDLSALFGGVPSEEFQEIEGESEERRRGRLERTQRTKERAAKALAEKNERDMQTQRDQAERHRIAETLDVEIKRWAAGKDGNLRALLSTLQYVLWPESGWQPVSLTDLITAASVKKVYRKATLSVHPDKVQQRGANLQQKYIAEKVFDLLKEAWNKFNSEELF